MHTDELFMRRCIELAQRSWGAHQPNPEVGAVLVHNGRIIGEGYHQQYGSAHAEVNAIAQVCPADQTLLPESTLYVTLEPCFHFGKTPPCVDLVLRKGIRRVVIGCRDPYEQVAGRSIEKLRAAGVEVVVGVLQQEIEWLNRRFFTQCRKKRPYIVLKYAVSKDGYMGIHEQNVRISGHWAQQLVHRWRSEESAILVGTHTALVDNPKLNNRLYLPLLHRQPVRLVLDRQGRLPQDLHLWDGSQPTWVFTQKAPTLDQPNVRFFEIDWQDNPLPAIFNILHQQRLQSVLVEGGQKLLRSLLLADLWDEARILVGDKTLGKGIQAPALIGAAAESNTLHWGNERIEWWIRKEEH